MKRVKFRKEEMEDEIKLDKGEACDPDISLSYIDEKLQDVLGHFQKDFEDGVSSENLGSKFGGYGSFLPTYQRSPSWSNTRTPTEAHNNNRSASPNSMLPKGGWRPSLASSSTSLSGRPIASSAYSAVVPAQKASAVNGKTNSATLPAQDEDSTSKSEVVKKQTNLSDSKTHKLYIRDNIENLSTQKSADIYSGLGLDVSPSSSLDDSPMNSESNDIKNSQFESPTSILQIMISYPTHDGLLLSPLSDDLICLSEKGKLWGHCGPEGMNQENLVTSVEFVHGIHDANRKVSEAKKRKSFDNVLENSHGNDNQNGSGVPSRKEIDADVNTCKELISKALKVPLLSNPYHNVVDPTKDAGRIINNPRTAVRGREAEKSSNIALEPVSTIEIDAVVRSDGNVISSGRITETKCHVVHSTEIVKEVSVADSSIESKSKKSFQRDTLLTKGGLEGMKKNHGRHRYRDFFGGIDAEEDDDETGLQEIHSPERPTDSDAVGMYGSKGLSNATKSKGLSNATKQDGSQPSNYVITNHQETPNCRSSSQTTHSLDEDRLQHLGPPNSSVVEERRHKNEEKKSFLNNHSDGGSKNAKMRNVREVDLNVSSKTVKRDDRHDDENWTVGPAVAKPGWSSSSGLSHSASGKVRDKYKNRDSKDGSKINLVSAKHSEAHTSDVSMHMGRCDSKDSLTKRKGRKLWDSDACNPQDFVQGTCDDTRRKEKKARVSKSDQKDSSASKGGGGTGGTDQVKKEKHTEQDLGITLSLQSVKAVDSSKMDLCNSQPSVAATSSSSKVSGSHKNKSSLQELKGSPVESVSSSPLRISNMDTRTNLERKGDCKNSISFPTSSPKRSFNGENHGFSNQSSMVKKNKACNGTNDDLKFSEVDFEEKDVVEVKINESGYATHQDADVNVDPLRQASQYACKTDNSDQGSYKERKNDRQCQNSESVSNSGNGSLLRHKEKNRASKFDSDKIPLDEEKVTPEKNKCQERSSVGSDRLKKSSKKDSSAKLTDKDVKGDSQSRSGHHCGAEVTLDVMSHSDKRKVAVPNRDDRRASKELVSNKSEQTEVSPRSPITGGQNETVVFKEPVTGSERENGASFPVVDGFERERSNASRQSRKAKSHPGNLPNSTSHKVRDLDVPSPVRKDSSSQAAANAIKEARNLKHLADRLKNSGSSESTGIYFQAALKFLHAASLQELDSAKHGAMNQSRRIYSSTAKLCQFCAHEYEKLKDMASAALAYKCMEVAYMRVIYSSNSDANRYRNELQIALQIFPPGESPFSSVSDVDNLNNPTTMVDKAALTKVVGSPQVAGTHVFSSTNSSSFMHLINLAQEVNFAMEASRKSRVAFASVNPGLGDAQCKERTLYVKKALDFNFQDVDGLLRLVRVAMEAISH